MSGARNDHTCVYPSSIVLGTSQRAAAHPSPAFAQLFAAAFLSQVPAQHSAPWAVVAAGVSWPCSGVPIRRCFVRTPHHLLLQINLGFIFLFPSSSLW